MTFLTGFMPDCQVTCILTSTNLAPIGVSEDCEVVPYGTSCRVAWAFGCESANHTELSCLATGKLERNSVPLYPVCEEESALTWPRLICLCRRTTPLDTSCTS